MLRNIVLAWLLGVAALASAPPAAAAQAEARTIILDVENMTCAMCPITVRKALARVPGVIEAEAKYEGDGAGWARVTFDPTATGVEALTRATADAGYPSRVRQE